VATQPITAGDACDPAVIGKARRLRQATARLCGKGIDMLHQCGVGRLLAELAIGDGNAEADNA
jgi:hypothetical protein